MIRKRKRGLGFWGRQTVRRWTPGGNWWKVRVLLVRFVCAGAPQFHLSPGTCVVLYLLVRERGRGTSGKFTSCFRQKGGGQRVPSVCALSQLPSAQHKPLSKWHILRQRVLIPFIMNQINSSAPVIQTRKVSQASKDLQLLRGGAGIWSHMYPTTKVIHWRCLCRRVSRQTFMNCKTSSEALL